MKAMNASADNNETVYSTTLAAVKIKDAFLLHKIHCVFVFNKKSDFNKIRVTHSVRK